MSERKHFKKALARMLSAALLITSLSITPITVNAAVESPPGVETEQTDAPGMSTYNYTKDHMGYTYQNGSITITNCDNVEGDFVIPSEIDGIPVTSIESGAFENNTKLTGITIPEGLTNFYRTFSGCTNLKKVVLPDNAVIDFYSFKGCTSLTDVTLGKHSTVKCAFVGCTGLKSIDIPEDCGIEASAFYDCSSLLTINNIENIRSLSSDSFGGTAWYNAQPDGDVYLGKYYYTYKGDIPKDSVINIRQGTEIICSGAFSGQKYARFKVVIPEGVTTIGSAAFSGCSHLYDITIPSSIVRLGDSAFSGTGWESNQDYGDIYVGQVYYKYKLKYKETNVNVKIRKGTVSIADRAFGNLSVLDSVTIPNTVKSIGAYAFLSCTGLTSLTIPDSVEEIKESAFWKCSSLSQVVLPKRMTSLGSSLFCECSALRSVNLPQGLTSIEDETFGSCTSLESIVIPDGVTKIGQGAFSYCEELKNVVIPESVCQIGSYSFDCCTNLGKIVLPDSVSFIGSYAFFCCTALKEINIPENMSCINENTFYHCAFEKINIPDHILSIGDNAFGDCSELKSILIPESVVKIDSEAFEGIESLDVYCNYPSYVYEFIFDKRWWGDYQLNIAGNILSNTTEIPEDEITIGESLMVNCSAQDGLAPYQYKVSYKKHTGTKWTTAQNYGTNASVAITPSAVAAYDIKVEVKDDFGVVKTYEKTINVSKTQPLENVSTLSSDTITQGESVNISCQGDKGLKPYTYTVLYQKSTSTNWKTLIKNSEDGSVTFTPDTYGTYTVRTKVKDAKGSVVSKDFTLTVNEKDPLVNQSVLSTDEILLGDTVDVSLEGTGGKSPYVYSVLYRKASGTSWTSLLKDSTETSVQFKPNAADTYVVRVKVRDTRGKVAVKEYSLKVTKPKPITNNSYLSKYKASYGREIGIYCEGQGGRGEYRYTVLYKKSASSSWTTLIKNSEWGYASFTPKVKTAYDVRVRITDEDGRTSTKTMTLEVMDRAPIINTSYLYRPDGHFIPGYGVGMQLSADEGSGNYAFRVQYKKTSETEWKTWELSYRDYGYFYEIGRFNYYDPETGYLGINNSMYSYYLDLDIGTYDLKLEVLDDIAMEGDVKTFRIDVSYDPPVNNSTIDYDQVETGRYTILHLDAESGSGEYTYSIYRKLASEKDYKTVCKNYKIDPEEDYYYNETSRTPYTYITFNEAGEYDLKVKVKDDLSGKVVSKDFRITVADYVDLSNIAEFMDGAAPVGDTHAINLGDTAVIHLATPVATYNRNFSVAYRMTGDAEWTEVPCGTWGQDYFEELEIAVFRPEEAGEYEVKVSSFRYVYDYDNYESHILYDTPKILHLTVNKVFAIKTIDFDHTAFLGGYSDIHVETVNGEGTVRYTVQVSANFGQDEWVTIADTTKKDMKFTPLATGYYELLVTATDASGHTASWDPGFIRVEEAEDSFSTISSNSLTLGESVQIICTGEQNIEYSYYFKVMYRKSGTSNWTEVKNFTADGDQKTYTFKPGVATNYEIKVMKLFNTDANETYASGIDRYTLTVTK